MSQERFGQTCGRASVAAGGQSTAYDLAQICSGEHTFRLSQVQGQQSGRGLREAQRSGDYVKKSKDACRILPPLGFWNRGKEFAEAGKLVAESRPQPRSQATVVEYYLYGHGIELLLKAFLSAKGYNEGQLKGKGLSHDLEKIMEAACSQGLCSHVDVTAEDLAALKIVNQYYCGKEFEYYEPGTMNLPYLARLKCLAAKIEEGCDDVVSRLQP